MEPTDLTIEILKDIRTEIRTTREELRSEIGSVRDELRTTREELSERIGRTNERIDVVVEGQIRLATEVVAVAGEIREVSALVREDRQLRAKVEDHDKRIARLEQRSH